MEVEPGEGTGYGGGGAGMVSGTQLNLHVRGHKRLCYLEVRDEHSIAQRNSCMCVSCILTVLCHPSGAYFSSLRSKSKKSSSPSVYKHTRT